MRLARRGFGSNDWSGHGSNDWSGHGSNDWSGHGSNNWFGCGAVPCADYEARAGPPERRRPGIGIERINERTTLLSAGPAQ
jgi:hypothetical protein